MARKLILLAMAVGALVAFAAPAMASAAELSAEGEPVPVGADITATSANLTTTTAAGTLECENVTIHAEVTANEPETAAAQSTAVTTTGCVTNQGGGTLIPTTIENGSTFLHLTNGASSAEATFVANIGPGKLLCHFEGTPAVTYVTNSDVIHVEGALTGTGENCPTTGFMEGDFTLETEGGVPIEIT